MDAAAQAARNADRAALEQLLLDARARTLRLFAAYETALRVPCQSELNLPLWELGHVGWFADWWIARNPERHRGAQAAPDLPRTQPHPAAPSGMRRTRRRLLQRQHRGARPPLAAPAARRSHHPRSP